MQIIDGHVARAPTLPVEVRETLPGGLVKTILKALAKNPEARYLSTAGLVSDLVYPCADGGREATHYFRASALR